MVSSVPSSRLSEKRRIKLTQVLKSEWQKFDEDEDAYAVLEVQLKVTKGCKL